MPSKVRPSDSAEPTEKTRTSRRMSSERASTRASRRRSFQQADDDVEETPRKTFELKRSTTMREKDLRKQHRQLDLFQAMLAHGIEAVAQRDHPADEKMYEEQLQRAALSDPVGRELRKGAARRPSHTGALLAVEERIAIAGIFVRHAMTRTELGRVSWASARARTLYRLANARWSRLEE